MTGAAREKCPPTGNYLFVDVRDAALGHVLALQTEGAAGKRFFIVASHFSNKEIAEIIGKRFPELQGKLPTGEALTPGDYPAAGIYDFDNRRSVDVLGLTYQSLENSIVDTVKSLQTVEKNG